MDYILLAGSNGIIGSYLCEKFNKNVTITKLSRKKSKIKKDFFLVDLNKKAEVKAFAESTRTFDLLIFLVGLAHKKGKGKDYKQFKLINNETIINLLSSLKEQSKLPKKIIFASTISVYGETMDRNIYCENTKLNPVSPYAITKIEAEEFLLNNFNIQTWILRISPVYTTNFLLNIDKRTKIGPIYYKVGEGEKKLSLCNIDNIYKSIQGILKNKIPPGIYNISDKNDYSYNDLLKYVDAKKVLKIPNLLVKMAYLLGCITSNIYLKENSIKLLTDNLFPSNKIRKYVNFSSNLKNKNV